MVKRKRRTYGYDAEGYDINGFNMYGYNRQGYDRFECKINNYIIPKLIDIEENPPPIINNINYLLGL